MLLRQSGRPIKTDIDRPGLNLLQARTQRLHGALKGKALGHPLGKTGVFGLEDRVGHQSFS